MSNRFGSCIAALLLPVFAAGCGITQADVEKSIREEVKTQMKVGVKSLELLQQPDGSYGGTMTTDNGEVYEVTSKVLNRSKIEWKAIPNQATVEKTVREGIEQQLKAKVKTLNLTRSAPAVYVGHADLDNGQRWEITTRMDGSQLRWEGKQAP